MNTPNNKRKQDSQEKIQKVFMKIIQTKNINEISISEICKKANINRSTFYANYKDIYDLIKKLKERITNDFINVYKDELENSQNNMIQQLENIKENQLFYKTYIKLNTDIDTNIYNINIINELNKIYKTKKYKEYHIVFFKSGINAIIKKWLENDCKETPKEINKLINNILKIN